MANPKSYQENTIASIRRAIGDVDIARRYMDSALICGPDLVKYNLQQAGEKLEIALTFIKEQM